MRPANGMTKSETQCKSTVAALNALRCLQNNAHTKPISGGKQAIFESHKRRAVLTIPHETKIYL